MADIPSSTWSETDASNTTASPDGAPEGMSPGGLNNTMRMFMGAVKRWYDWTSPATTAGTSTVYTLSYSVAPAALVDGMPHLVLFHTTSGASPTLNVNTLGAKPLYRYVAGAWSQITTASAIPANFLARIVYNASEGSYRITNPIAGTGAYNVLELDSAGALPSGIGGVWSTGDAKLTWKTTADSGWVMMDDGSIGNAASAATTRANADTVTLFTLLWNNLADAQAPVSGGRGASAAIDYAANKRLTLPKVLGRALAISGAGSGLTARTIGVTVGTETHTLTEAEMPAHTHSLGVGVLSSSGPTNFAGGGALGNPISATDSTGGGGSHNNMQPSIFLNVMIKL